MSENTNSLKCPKCGYSIDLAKNLAGPLLEKIKKEHAEELAALKDTMASAEYSIRTRITAEEKKKAEAAVALKEKEEQKIKAVLEEENAKLTELIALREAKLAGAQKAEAAYAKKSRELDEQKRELDLEVERKISEQLGAVEAKARAAAESTLSLKLAEREHTIAAMNATITEMKQKAEQGDQRLQGEVQELALEQMLKTKFPLDTITEVAKGVQGADCLQTVADSTGKTCGSIVWESKRTRNFTDSWLPKLRDDQRNSKAELCVLVTQVLPKDVKGFDCIDGVWICSMELVLPVATILRQSLMEIQMAKGSKIGQKQKMELLYDYLTGTQFRQRVQAIVENYSNMQEDLQKERRAIKKMWAVREMQITSAMDAAIGLHGDVVGLAGAAIAEIPELNIKQIATDKQED